MKNFKKCGLLLASLLGLLLPACGGGGENQDTYVSVQQFETGSKGFYIVASPSLRIRSTGGYIDGSKHEAPKQYLNEVMERLGLSGEAESTFVEGEISGGTDSAVCDIGYYTLGEQYGILHVAIQSDPGSGLGFLAYAMGCFLPSDVVQGPDGILADAQVYEGRVVPTMAGVSLEGTFDFATGMATLGLNWSVSTEMREELDEAGLTYPVQASLPFFAVSL